MVAAARLQVEVDANTNRAEAALARFLGQIGGTGLAMAGLGAGIAAGAAAAALAIGKIGVSYDDALNTFRAVSGATTEQMNQVRSTAKALGNDTDLVTASAADAATAMGELAKGGLSVDESMKAAKGTLALAAAAGVSVEDAANIAAKALNTFGLDGSKAGLVADVLAAGANKSAASLPEMANALQQVGASASNAGLTLEDTAAIIGELANNGITGSDAGTSLKTMLSSLIAPAGEGASQMKALGLSMYDANGKMVPFREMLSRTASAIGGLKTEQEKAAAIQRIFGSDASRAAQILLKEGVPGFDAMRAGVVAHGQALDVAKVKSQGFGGQLRILQSTLETLAISIYDGVKGPLAEFTGALISGLNASVAGIQQFAADAKAALDTFLHSEFFTGTIVPTVRAIQDAFAKVGEFFTSTLLPALDSIMGPIGGLNSVLPILAAMLGGPVVAAVAVLGAALAGLVGGALLTALVVFTSIPAIIGGFVAALVLAYQHSETFRNIVQAAFGVVQTVVAAVVEWFTGTFLPAMQSAFTAVTGVVQSFGGFWQRIWPAITETVSIAWSIIGPLVTAAMTVIGTAIGVGLTAIQAVWSVAWTAISGVLGVIWGVIKGVVTSALDVIKGIIKIVLGVITGDWGLAWEGIKNVLSGVWNLMKTVVSAALGVIKTVIETALAVVQGIWATGWAAVKGALSAAWAAITGVLSAALAGLQAVLSSGLALFVDLFVKLPGRILSGLGSLAGLLVSAGHDLIMGFVKGIGDAAGAAVQKAKEVADSVVGGVKGALGINSPSRVFRELGVYSGQGLALGLADMARTVAGAGEDLARAAIPTGLGDALAGSLTGAGATGVGQGTVTYTVAPGAIQIDARGATPETIPMLQTAADDALARLVSELQAGRR